jgi:hypothetical protein
MAKEKEEKKVDSTTTFKDTLATRLSAINKDSVDRRKARTEEADKKRRESSRNRKQRASQRRGIVGFKGFRGTQR